MAEHARVLQMHVAALYICSTRRAAALRHFGLKVTGVTPIHLGAGRYREHRGGTYRRRAGVAG